jgi:methylthioribose-1-phosphate isomerase
LQIDGLTQPIANEGKRFSVLDQRALPEEEAWIQLDTLQDYVKAIKTLTVRGAPTIGVVAAHGVARLHAGKPSKRTLEEICTALEDARPTAVNLAVGVQYVKDRILQAWDKGGTQAAVHASKAGKDAATTFEEAEILNSQFLVQKGGEILKQYENFTTICNTGPLAAPGYGTALGCIFQASLPYGKDCHVYVPETRPLRQGARLTMWEIQKAARNVTGTLMVDSAISHMMGLGLIDCVVVGADRIASNGDTANKVGTRSLAINAFYHKIPFYVAAPTTTIDMQTLTGKDIALEMRDGDEVDPVWAADNTVMNLAFDVTPAHLITAIIHQGGVISPSHLSHLMSGR